MGLKRSTAKSEKTRIRLLEAAGDVLSQRGLSELTLAALGASAGVTRGCVQYYFMTPQDLLAPLAKYVAERETEIFEAACAGCSGDLIGFTLERAAHRAADRYRKARLELIAAARFNPKLRSALAQGAMESEAAMLAHAARMLGDEGVADSPRFRAGSDLAALVSDHIASRLWPDRPGERAEGVLFALRLALSVLWRENGASAAKLRVRVRAGTGSV